MSYYVFPASRGSSITGGHSSSVFTSPPLVSPSISYSVALGSRYGQSASAKARYEQLGWEEVTPPNASSKRQAKNSTCDESAVLQANSSGDITQSSYHRSRLPGVIAVLGNNSTQVRSGLKPHSSRRRNANANTPTRTSKTTTQPTTPAKDFPTQINGVSQDPLSSTTAINVAFEVAPKSDDDEEKAVAPRSILAELLAQQEEERQRRLDKDSPSAKGRSNTSIRHVDPSDTQSLSLASKATPPTERSLHFELAGNDEDSSLVPTATNYSKQNSSELATPTRITRKRSSTVAFEERTGEQNTSTTSNNLKHHEDAKESPSTPLSASASPASPNITNPQTALMTPYFTQILIDQCATTLQRQKQQQLRILTSQPTIKDPSNTFTVIGGGMHPMSATSTSPSNISVMATPKRYRLRGSGLETSNSSFPSSGVNSRMVSRLDTPTPNEADAAVSGSNPMNKKGAGASMNTSQTMPSSSDTYTPSKGQPQSHSASKRSGHLSTAARLSSSGASVTQSIEAPTNSGSKPGSLLLKFHLNRKEMAGKTSLVTNQLIDAHCTSNSSAGGRSTHSASPSIPCHQTASPPETKHTVQKDVTKERSPIPEEESTTTSLATERSKTLSAPPHTSRATSELKPSSETSSKNSQPTKSKPPTPATPPQPKLYVSEGRNASNLSNTSNTNPQVWEGLATAYGSRTGSLLQSPPKGAVNVWDEVFEME